MKVALNDREIYKAYDKCFTAEQLTAEPYSCIHFVEVSDEYKDCEFSDFDNGIFNIEKYTARKSKQELAVLRACRAAECFSVIDRSVLWHNSLTDLQKAELSAWYTAWLNVTETKVIPEKPAWLEEA